MKICVSYCLSEMTTPAKLKITLSPSAHHITSDCYLKLNDKTLEYFLLSVFNNNLSNIFIFKQSSDLFGLYSGVLLQRHLCTSCIYSCIIALRFIEFNRNQWIMA